MLADTCERLLWALTDQHTQPNDYQLINIIRRVCYCIHVLKQQHRVEIIVASGEEYNPEPDYKSPGVAGALSIS